jgi:hypothetical protein
VGDAVSGLQKTGEVAGVDRLVGEPTARAPRSDRVPEGHVPAARRWELALRERQPADGAHHAELQGGHRLEACRARDLTPDLRRRDLRRLVVAGLGLLRPRLGRRCEGCTPRSACGRRVRCSMISTVKSTSARPAMRHAARNSGEPTGRSTSEWTLGGNGSPGLIACVGWHKLSLSDGCDDRALTYARQVSSKLGGGRLPLDQARLRPHLRERARLVEQQAAVLRRIGRAAADGVDTSAPRWKTTARDVDYERMRGLPMIAPGVRGAQKGTDPLGEVIRRSERRR